MEDAANLVIYETPPFANNEEEIATSFYILQDETSEKSQDSNIESIPKDESVDCESSQTAKETMDHVQDTMDVENAVNEESVNVEPSISSGNQSVPTDAETTLEKGECIDKLTCKHCNKTFTRMTNVRRHLRSVHKIVRENGTNIKCIECNISFKHIFKLREHLQSVHHLNMDEEELRFPNINAFKKWKCDMERKTLSSYTLRHGARKCRTGPRYLYVCHRSGKYNPKIRGPRQRMIRAQGSCKMGISCTATIQCTETPREVIVKYCPHHYGHGKDTTYIQLTPEEQTAISESLEKGVPFENLLDDIRENQSSKDHFQLHLLKKKDIRSINKAFEYQDFNTELSDAESVDRWIETCCQLENSPILFYQKEEFVNEEGNQDEFMLIIMTEFQKHILLSSSKQIVCVDNLYRKKGARFYLTVLFILDEMDLAFPVAFCISNRVNKTVISKFFASISEQTGPISAQYFMSDSENFYYDAWKEVMNDESKWLWSMWFVDSRIRIQMRIYKGNTEKRAEVYKIMRILLECPNETVFTCMFDNFIKDLLNNPKSRELGNFIQQKYGSNPQIWATCYRKDIELSTVIHLEIMHRTFRYCCRLGRKTRLDKFLFVLMKVIRDKMLDRLSNILDEDRKTLAIETINICHKMGLEILPEHITALSDKIWLIRSDNEGEKFYVTIENTTCPEHCSLRCVECDICVHMYTCTCLNNLINANLCAHIHAVVWNFINPHFSPPVSDGDDVMQEIEEACDYKEPSDNCTEMLQGVLKRTHQLYKIVQSNKCELSKESLDGVIHRVNECIDICTGKFKLSDKPSKPSDPKSNVNTVLILNPYIGNNSTQPCLQTSNVPNTANAQYVILVPKAQQMS